MTDGLRIVPANEASCADLDELFGGRGSPARCRCQRYKLERGESFGATPVEVRAERLREQTACGDPAAATTSGLLAFDDATPVGWCAVEPRPHLFGMTRVARVPWDGRDEDRTDPSVWVASCLVVRAGHRRAGVSRALALAAVRFAHDRGARALEAYPMTTTATALLEELHVGTVATWSAAGLREVHRPTLRRAVMRIDW